MVEFSMYKKTVLVILLVTVIVVSGAFAYILTSLTPFCGTTRTVVISVSYNTADNCVFLNVTSWVNKTFVFDEATVKDSKGQILASSDFVPTILPAFETVDLKISLGRMVLPSGKGYVIELYTFDGNIFSSFLTIYEKVETRVSLFNANNLQVDIQSFANQTIVFDKATINDFHTNQFNYESPSFSQLPENTELSPVKLLPNENLSFNIFYEQGFTPGNYTFFLYSSSPESQYVDGAWAFFTITGLENCFNRVGNIERIAFDNTDNGKLLVQVQSLSNDVVLFTSATLKESISVPAGRYYAVVDHRDLSPIELPSYGNETITVSFVTHRDDFESGSYTLTLFSEGNAIWVPFSIPLT